MAGLLSVPGHARRTAGSRSGRGARGAGGVSGRRRMREGAGEETRRKSGGRAEARGRLRRACPGRPGEIAGAGRARRCGARPGAGARSGAEGARTVRFRVPPARRPARTRAPWAAPAPGLHGPGGPLRGPLPRCLRVLLACGRAPGRALWPGHHGSACMDAAWVGPLHWTRRAGGIPLPHSPQAADRSGGRTAPPGPCDEPARAVRRTGPRGADRGDARDLSRLGARAPITRQGPGSGPGTVAQRSGTNRCEQ